MHNVSCYDLLSVPSSDVSGRGELMQHNAALIGSLPTFLPLVLATTRIEQLSGSGGATTGNQTGMVTDTGRHQMGMGTQTDIHRHENFKLRKTTACKRR